MKVEQAAIYRCDHCQKMGRWDIGWSSLTMLINRKANWEYEFHVCSDACLEAIRKLNKKERKRLLQQA